MIADLKQWLYIPLASYFVFLSKIKLLVWRPRIVVVTGSIGKTTLFHLLKSQISESDAFFAEHANSAYGVPINILGLKSNGPQLIEWIKLFIMAPFAVLTNIPQQKIYIVEADCDRPAEGKLLAELLKPEVTVWVSSTVTHSANFDHLIGSKFQNAEEAIAHEFGYFVENTSKLVIANTDFNPIKKQLERAKAKTMEIKVNDYLKNYEVNTDGTVFNLNDKSLNLSSIVPQESLFSLIACEEVVNYLGLEFDPTFEKFESPAGRGTLLKGINDSVIIDSSYNASSNSVVAMLDVLNKIAKKEKKTAVFLMGDMRELGEEAEQEHKKVARKINETVDILYTVGPLTEKYVLPNIEKKVTKQSFKNAKEVGEYMKNNLPKDSIVLVKGSQNELFLEDAIELILKNPEDKKKLPRQEKIWQSLKNN